MISTDRPTLEAVRQAVSAAGIEINAQLARVPKIKKLVEGRDAEVLINLVEALEDHDDVQKVYSDFELSEAELQRLSQ